LTFTINSWNTAPLTFTSNIWNTAPLTFTVNSWNITNLKKKNRKKQIQLGLLHTLTYYMKWTVITG
jgi:hypothetical protein